MKYLKGKSFSLIKELGQTEQMRKEKKKKKKKIESIHSINPFCAILKLKKNSSIREQPDR